VERPGRGRVRKAIKVMLRSVFMEWKATGRFSADFKNKISISKGFFGYWI
jgi:hypothetical protein